MGTLLSSPDDPNPNTTAAAAATTATTTAAMSQTPSENPANPDQENTSQPPITLETPESLNPDQELSKPVQDNENPDQELIEEEEEGECPFCAYMKGGECRETFINWEKCIEEGEKNGEDIVEKCVEVTTALKKCMEANQDYYAPILQAEKSAEQQVRNQLEQEKAKEAENAKEAKEAENPKEANEASSGEDEEKVKQETS